MRRNVLQLSAVALFLGAGPASAQQVKSPADLFPARTLGYAELRQPGKLVQQVRNLFQGSALGNVPQSLDRFRSREDPNSLLYHRTEPAGALGLMLSPEVAAEAARLRGAAVGLLGVNPREGPEFLAVILPGGSTAPSFFFRALLTMAPVRPTGKVEGVTLYRPYHLVYQGGPNPHAERREVGPVFAMMPGVLLVGSPGAVKDAVRRVKGKGDGESLAQSASFKEALKAADPEPGLFAYLDTQAVGSLAEALAGREKGGPEHVAAVLRLVNLKAFRATVYSVTLNRGTFRFRKTALLNPKEKSPLLELMPTTPVNPDLLHYAPGDAVLVAALSNGGARKRWDRFLELADDLAKQGGNGGPVPSDHVKQVGERLKVDLGKDVFAKIANLAFAMGDPLKAPVKKRVVKGPNFESVSIRPEIPMVVVVEMTDEASARKVVDDLVPRILGLAAGQEEAVRPKAKEIEGQKVYALPLGRGEAMHFGRQGKVIVAGPYQGPVAKALAAGAAGKGWLADDKAAGRVKALGNAQAFAFVKPVTLLMSAVGGRTFAGSAEARAVATPAAEEKPIEEVREGRDKEAQKVMKELGKLTALEEPLVMSLTHEKDRWVFETEMGGLKPLVARLTNFVVEQLYRSSGMRQPGVGTIRPATPAPIKKDAPPQPK